MTDQLDEARAPGAVRPGADGITRRFLAALGTRGALLLLGGVAGVVLARALQPELRGQYYLIVTICTSAYVVAQFSLERAQMQQYAAGKPVQVLTAGAVIAGSLLGVLAAGLALVLVEVNGGMAARYPVALLLGLISVPASAVAINLSSLFVLVGRTTVVNRSQLSAAVVQFGVLIGLVVSGHATVLTVLAAWLASALVNVGILLLASGVSLRRFEPRTAARALVVGSGYHVGTCALYLLWRIDVLLLADRVSPTALGLYSLAVTLTEMTATVGDAVAQAGTSRQLSGDLRAGAEISAQLVRLALLGSTVLVTLVCCSAPVLVPLLYGSAYSGVVPALIALAPGVVFLAASRAATSYLVRFNAPLRMSTPAVVGLTANVLLNLILIPHWGIVGSAIASSIAYALLALLQAWWLCHETQIRPRDLIPRPDDVLRFARRLRPVA